MTHQATRGRLVNHFNNKDKGIWRSQLRRRFQLLRVEQGGKLGNRSYLESMECNHFCYVLLGSLYKRREHVWVRALKKNSKNLSYLLTFLSLLTLFFSNMFFLSSPFSSDCYEYLHSKNEIHTIDIIGKFGIKGCPFIIIVHLISIRFVIN